MSLTVTLVATAVTTMAVALLLAMIRLLRGPTLPDRVVAFDLLTLHVLGIICGAAILTGQWVLLDAAIILALLTFLATIALARHVERRAREEGPRDA